MRVVSSCSTPGFVAFMGRQLIGIVTCRLGRRQIHCVGLIGSGGLQNDLEHSCRGRPVFSYVSIDGRVLSRAAGGSVSNILDRSSGPMRWYRTSAEKAAEESVRVFDCKPIDLLP